jgi:hypothetical protein
VSLSGKQLQLLDNSFSTAHFPGLVASKVQEDGVQEITMAFQNDAEFQDDFRRVGADVTAEFEPVGSPNDPTEHASSENLEVAPKDDDLEDDDESKDDDDLDEEDDEDDDLEEDEEEDDEEDEDEDDLEEDDDEEDEEEEDIDYEDDDEDEAEDDELEEDDDTVKARNTGMAAAARKR